MQTKKINSMTAARKIAVACFALLSYSAVSGASDLQPDLIKSPGQPVQLKFADGREAVLKMTIQRGVTLPIGFKITENTCNEKVGASCTYSAPISQLKFFFVWSKNNDSSKLDQELVVPALDSNPERKMEFQSLISNLSKADAPTNAEVLAIPEQFIKCSTFDWFEPNVKGNPSTRVVRAISSELTLKNSETNSDENRFFGTIRNVQISAQSADTWIIKSGQITKNLFTAQPFLFFNDSAWYVQKNDGEVCQFTGRARIDAAIAAFQKAVADSKKSESEATLYLSNPVDDKLYNIDGSINSQIIYSVGSAK